MNDKRQAIYLDAIATTPVAPEVIKAMAPFWGEKFGNASSIHSFGRAALMAIDEARESVARFFGVRRGDVYFTGSATEANNWALWGIVQAAAEKFNRPLKDLHVVTSAIEHKAVLAMAHRLEKSDVRVTFVKPTCEGIITAEAAAAAIEPATVLVSVMYVNNEVGSIQPIQQISKIVEKERLARSAKNYTLTPIPYPLYFHTDAVQAVQFLDCSLDRLGADALTISAHKIYGPKGVGALMARAGVPLEPFVIGGGQELEKRAGTENVAGIVGLAVALKLVSDRREQDAKKVAALRDEFWQGIQKAGLGARLNGPVPGEQRIANNLNVCFGGADGPALLMALDLAGVAASAGSACTTGSIEPSSVLLAMGLSKAEARASIRFGLSRHTTRAEIKKTLAVLPKLAAQVRG